MSLKQTAGYTVLSAPASAAAGVTPTELIPDSTSAFHRTLRSRDACTAGKGWKPPKHPAFACELTQMTKRCQTNVTEESDRKLDTRYTAHTWSLRIHNHYRTKNLQILKSLSQMVVCTSSCRSAFIFSYSAGNWAQSLISRPVSTQGSLKHLIQL